MHSISILYYPITLEGRRGTTDEFTTIPFHLVLFSAALVELAKSIPVHSLKCINAYRDRKSGSKQQKMRIEYITKIAWQSLNMLLLKFKLKRSSLEKIYNSFVRPFMEYSDSVWDESNKLESIHT